MDILGCVCYERNSDCSVKMAASALQYDIRYSEQEIYHILA